MVICDDYINILQFNAKNNGPWMRAFPEYPSGGGNHNFPGKDMFGQSWFCRTL